MGRRFQYSVSRSGPDKRSLYDASGRRVRVLMDGPAAMGQGEYEWDGRLASGGPAPGGAAVSRWICEASRSPKARLCDFQILPVIWMGGYCDANVGK